MKRITLIVLIVGASILITTPLVAETAAVAGPTAGTAEVVGAAPLDGAAPVDAPYGPAGVHPMDSCKSGECEIVSWLPGGRLGLGVVAAALVGMVYFTRRRPQSPQ